MPALILFLAALTLIVAGTALIYLPAALIVAGVLLCALVADVKGVW